MPAFFCLWVAQKCWGSNKSANLKISYSCCLFFIDTTCALLLLFVSVDSILLAVRSLTKSAAALRVLTILCTVTSSCQLQPALGLSSQITPSSFSSLQVSSTLTKKNPVCPAFVNITTSTEPLSFKTPDRNMAWRCSGSSNAELVSNLKARGLYSSKEVS